MKRIYYLSTCDTCKKLMKEWSLGDDFEKIDLKKSPLSAEELDQLRQMAGSYEALFNKRARMLREKGIKASELSESQMKGLLLEHYSFLARPVVIVDSRIFIGNSKSNSETLKAHIS